MTLKLIDKTEIKKVLTSKRFWFGTLIGLMMTYYIIRPVSSDMDIVKGYFQKIMPENVANMFSDDNVETTPADNFKTKYQKTHKIPYRKRFTMLIPGIGTSHLELWKSKPCFQKHIRNQIWGSPNMILSLLFNKNCWLEHMKLKNGTDPDDIKVRVLKDLQSAEYFIGAYWVWARIVENLIALDYDVNDIYAAVYDWRLAHEDLEKRDGYFNEVKATIENKVRHSQLKAVVLTHSMGALVFYNFMKWVESPLGGNGGDGWVSDHINSVVNIGGPFLGCAKVISGVLSGEMKDTAQLGPYGNTILEATFTREERRDLFWSWYGAFSMLPKGGNRVWGNEWIAADDIVDRQFQKCFNRHRQTCAKFTFEIYFANYGHHSGAMVSLIDENTHLTIDSILEMMGRLANKPKEWETIQSLYSHGFLSKSEMNLTNPKDIIRSWTNPLASTLPKMYNSSRTSSGKFLLPSELNNTLKIYCFYGHGLPTERKYFYKNAQQLQSNEETVPQIDVAYLHEKSNTRHGVQLGDGDGTVNIISLAGVCLQAWSLTKYNPSKIQIITKEFKHEQIVNSLNPNEILRGGKKTADHIDVLGNYELIEDVLRIAVEPQLKVTPRVRKSTIAIAKSLHLND